MNKQWTLMRMSIHKKARQNNGQTTQSIRSTHSYLWRVFKWAQEKERYKIEPVNAYKFLKIPKSSDIHSENSVCGYRNTNEVPTLDVTQLTLWCRYSPAYDSSWQKKGWIRRLETLSSILDSYPDVAMSDNVATQLNTFRTSGRIPYGFLKCG